LQLREWKSGLGSTRAAQYRIVQIEAEMLDEAGSPCTGASQVVTVSLENGGKILGMENGDLGDCTEYSSLRRRLYRGKLIIYVLLPCDIKEPVLLTAAVEGLNPEQIRL
jgi:hypothetical protein